MADSYQNPRRSNSRNPDEVTPAVAGRRRINSLGRVRMELRGRERHRWAKPRGRNERERMSQAFTSSTADFRFQPAPVPEPVHPQYDRHQKINPTAPLDLLGRQSKRQDQ